MLTHVEFMLNLFLKCAKNTHFLDIPILHPECQWHLPPPFAFRRAPWDTMVMWYALRWKGQLRVEFYHQGCLFDKHAVGSIHRKVSFNKQKLVVVRSKYHSLAIASNPTCWASMADPLNHISSTFPQKLSRRGCIRLYKHIGIIIWYNPVVKYQPQLPNFQDYASWLIASVLWFAHCWFSCRKGDHFLRIGLAVGKQEKISREFDFTEIFGPRTTL